jgi:3D-(3,5/4)-trihydroxycyclohexane-1,2-dione acylhydrolase (decyclizing)
MNTIRLTAAQAMIRFLANQYVERDGIEHRFFHGCFGIFGHGNVAGIGQALYESPSLLRYYQARNEQSMVLTAAGFARMRNRLGTLICTTSIGPGATNMVTGAALATVNRLPVLLLPGDVFASRVADPVLQQLETPWRGDVSVNDAFQPVSRYWDRINRPEQVVDAGLHALRVLTNQADTGAVTLAFPQDVQTEAFDYPAAFLRRRVWPIGRPLPPTTAMERAAAIVRQSRRPLIVAGGGVIYSEATQALASWCNHTGIPVAETQAGKGSLAYDHPSAVGAIGASGGLAANRLAHGADVVIGIGVRWTDFTTGSSSLFQNPDVRFVNINVADFDANKERGTPLVGDARATLEALSRMLAGHTIEPDYRSAIAAVRAEWSAEVDRQYGLGHALLPAQSEVIGALNAFVAPGDVVVCAAGSMPADLHKLWRATDPKAYHVEYGYSCMGYEIAGALGAKMAAPDRNVYVLVGDGSYLMLNEAIATSVQEGLKLTLIIVDNHGFSSIGALSRSVGENGFGTHYRYRHQGSLGLDSDGPRGEVLPLDLAQNAASLGAHAIRATTIDDLRKALVDATAIDGTVAIVIEVDRFAAVPSYESWWEVAIPEVSDQDEVRSARQRYKAGKATQRRYL